MKSNESNYTNCKLERGAKKKKKKKEEERGAKKKKKKKKKEKKKKKGRVRSMLFNVLSTDHIF